jgi:hypothetical protein
MANELSFYGVLNQTGLTVTAKVYNNVGSQVGSDVVCSEAGVLAIYIGDMPTTPIGQYGVRFFNGSVLLGQGSIFWSGSQELTLDSFQKTDEIHQIQGLDINNPLTTTEDSMNAGDIDIEITGNGETLSVFTRI